MQAPLQDSSKELATVVNRHSATIQSAYDLDVAKIQDVEFSMIRREMWSLSSSQSCFSAGVVFCAPLQKPWLDAFQKPVKRKSSAAIIL